MPNSSRVVSPGPGARSVRTAAGAALRPPADWVLVPPGDAALTRRLKAAGPTWSVQEKRGRKNFSLGVWPPQAVVAVVRDQLAAERSTPAYARKREAGAHREREHARYAQSFRQAVLDFLAFDGRHADLAGRLAAWP